MTCGPLAFICDAAGSATSAVASSGFNAIAQSFGEAASSMCNWMWSAISTNTTVNLTGGWFTNDLAITGGLAAVMIAALFIIQVIKGALQRDPRTLGRAITGCAIAFVGAAAAITITDALLVMTDQLSDGIVQTAGLGDLQSMGQKMTPVALLGGGGFTPALVIFLSFFFVIASVLVWAVFLIRKAMIIVAAVFAPIAFGGAATDATRSWVRKWIEFTLAMIFSKLVIVLIFTLAISLIGQSGSGGNGLSTLMTGLLLLLMACFAPWMLLKLVHFVGGDIAAAHQTAMVADARSAVHTAVGVPSSLKGSAQKVFAGGGSSGAHPGGTPEVAAAAAPAVAVGGVGGVGLAAARAPRTVATKATSTAVGDHVRPAADSAPASNAAPSRAPSRAVDWSEAT